MAVCSSLVPKRTETAGMNISFRVSRAKDPCVEFHLQVYHQAQNTIATTSDQIWKRFSCAHV